MQRRPGMLMEVALLCCLHRRSGGGWRKSGSASSCAARACLRTSCRSSPARTCAAVPVLPACLCLAAELHAALTLLCGSPSARVI